MKKDFYKVVGIMSGTSLDGIDFVVCNFQKDPHGGWGFTLSHPETIVYSSHWLDRLTKAIHFSNEELDSLNRDYTQYLGNRIKYYLEKYAISELDAICSHGHTILHQPDQGRTLQIGNLPQLAQYVGERVICDFRVQDVELGGQGAPLVPIGDQLLFSDFAYCLNLGGFANISFNSNGARIAYDICPVNVVLNSLAKRKGKAFDKDGAMAAQGSLDESLLRQLNALEYFDEVPPKSLGMEWVNRHVIPILEASSLDVDSLLRTYTEHIALQLSKNLRGEENVLATGGGAYNTFLMDRFKALSSNTIVIPNDSIVEYKEALVFGLLGVLRLRNEVNCLASVTGAKCDHSSGNIFLP